MPCLLATSESNLDECPRPRRLEGPQSVLFLEVAGSGLGQWGRQEEKSQGQDPGGGQAGPGSSRDTQAGGPGVRGWQGDPPRDGS